MRAPISSRQSLPSLASAVGWSVSERPVAYRDAVEIMEARVQAIAEARAREVVWLVEHPPLYTAGTSTRPADLLSPGRFPVHRTGRGGQLTYHGPGQRVAYVMLDVKRRGGDVRAFVGSLERWLIAALGRLGVASGTRAGRVGVWVERAGEEGGRREDKIAAIGIRVRRSISFHGVSVNVSPDLAHYGGIVPCGIAGHGVTSLRDLGIAASMADCDGALRAAFKQEFGVDIVEEVPLCTAAAATAEPPSTSAAPQ